MNIANYMHNFLRKGHKQRAEQVEPISREEWEERHLQPTAEWLIYQLAPFFGVPQAELEGKLPRVQCGFLGLFGGGGMYDPLSNEITLPGYVCRNGELDPKTSKVIRSYAVKNFGPLTEECAHYLRYLARNRIGKREYNEQVDEFFGGLGFKLVTGEAEQAAYCKIAMDGPSKKSHALAFGLRDPVHFLHEHERLIYADDAVVGDLLSKLESEMYINVTAQ